MASKTRNLSQVGKELGISPNSWPGAQILNELYAAALLETLEDKLHTPNFNLPISNCSLRRLSIIIQSQRLSPRRGVRIKVRLLRQTRHSGPVSWLRALIIP